MNEVNKYSIKKLEDAFESLSQGAKIAKDELSKDGVIQRFEFTFELLWKALKIYLEKEGINVKTPKESLKETFRLELIKNEKVFLNMLEDRNKTVHIYNKSESEKIFERIKTEYIDAIGKLIKELKGSL